MAYLKRACPTCETNPLNNVVIHSDPRAELLSFDELKSYWSGFFKTKAFFSYQRCACGLLYCPVFFNEPQLTELYTHMSDNTAGVSLDPLIKTQYHYFTYLKKYSKLTGEYLELGPDIGLFTENCVREGNFSSYWLIEPNNEVWPTLQKKIDHRKLQLINQLTHLANISENSLSTVVMIHVLDHLIHPLSLLKELKNKLTQNAVLLFVTHDENSFLAKLIKTKWPAYCLQHPQLFNHKSLKNLLELAGYQVLTCEKSINYFPVTYLIKHFLYLFGIKNIHLPQLNPLQIGLKLGNIITVAKNQ